MARFAAFLFLLSDLTDRHASVDGFDHVIDRQQGRWYGHHGFHFNHGLPNGLCGHQAMDSLRLFIDCEFSRHMSQTDGMTEGG